MTLWPVITRELRAEARRPFTSWLRVLGAGAALVQVVFQIQTRGFPIQQGSVLLVQLQATLLAAIFVLVPLVTADCISRERREGTLGLLFLTPLKAPDIVVAKTLVHGLRALTLCLAALPALALPLLMGGVTWPDVVIALLTLGSAFCWALAAGLLASARSKVWTRALIAAALCSFVGFVLFCYLSLVAASSVAGSTASFRGLLGMPNRAQTLEDVLWLGFWDGLQWAIGLCHLVYPRFPGTPMLTPPQLLTIWGSVGVLSLLVLVAAVLAAARRVRRGWQDQPPSALRQWSEQTFCTPVLWEGFLRRLLRRRLERNPIGWLVHRSWSGRLVAWGWLAVVISFASFAVTNPLQAGREFIGAFDLLAALILGSIAITASGSFQRERETGVLELMLVTPLRVKDIIGGRLRGVWGQFLPAGALLVGIWLYLATAIPGRQMPEGIVLFSFTFATLPVIGLYFSLRCRNFFAALVCTVLAGWLLPSAAPILASLAQKAWLGANFLRSEFYLHWPDEPPMLWLPAAQGFVAILCARRLYVNLRQRRFALGRGSASP